ncbi:MAG: HD domain-containing protein [Coriobacteriales bacterium]|nr:HD domain-containing protein [Coriobacteriales bacterium]
MQIDRKRARESFAAYVADYDPHNPRIALKIAHTYRVAELCARIAAASTPAGPGLTPQDVDLAWLCGLLHDVGRFEQVRRYDTFNDAASISHAALGVDVLFGEADPRGPQIRSYLNDDAQDELIRTTIATHSDYRLPEELDERTRVFCNVLRDADKIDILRVNGTCPLEDIYGVSEHDMYASELTPEVVELFYQHQTLPRSIRRHPADVLVGHICFAWELVYPESRAIMAEQGFLEGMLSRRFERADTQETFGAMASHMRAELAE